MTTVSAPPRLLQQLDAATKGRQVVASRARLAAEMRRLDREAACVRLVDLLRADLPDCLHTLEAWRFVSLIPRVPGRTWRGWLKRAGVSERRELRKLSDRQRATLIEAIGSYGLAAA